LLTNKSNKNPARQIAQLIGSERRAGRNAHCRRLFAAAAEAAGVSTAAAGWLIQKASVAVLVDLTRALAQRQPPAQPAPVDMLGPTTAELMESTNEMQLFLNTLLAMNDQDQ